MENISEKLLSCTVMVNVNGAQRKMNKNACPTRILAIKSSLIRGAWVAQLVWHLSSVQVLILGFWDGALRQYPCSVANLLLPLLLWSCCLSQINK